MDSGRALGNAGDWRGVRRRVRRRGVDIRIDRRVLMLVVVAVAEVAGRVSVVEVVLVDCGGCGVTNEKATTPALSQIVRINANNPIIIV